MKKLSNCEWGEKKWQEAEACSAETGVEEILEGKLMRNWHRESDYLLGRNELKPRTEATIFVVVLAPATGDNATILCDFSVSRAVIHISFVLLLTFQFHVIKSAQSAHPWTKQHVPAGGGQHKTRGSSVFVTWIERAM